MVARLNQPLIEKIVSSFPNGRHWQRLPCCNCGTDGEKKQNWVALSHLNKKGGIYAFLLPAEKFRDPRIIHLHAPKNKPKIQFEFTLEPICDGLAVVYVGRTTNLKQRFCAHHRPGKRISSAQVKFGLMDCQIVCHADHEECQRLAISFLRKYGHIVYTILDGSDQTANREIIEHSLCAEFCPPFNIKSER